MAVTKLLIAATVLAAALVAPVQAQTPKPKPAFPGQTDAPAPAKASPAIKVETIATGLNAPWSCAFLPDGRILITESGGTMRIVRRDGVVGGPIAGVPPVKSVAAQGLHDWCWIRLHATGLCLLHISRRQGERRHDNRQFFYEHVWEKPLAERRTMRRSARSASRARSASTTCGSKMPTCWPRRQAIVVARTAPLCNRRGSVPGF